MKTVLQILLTKTRLKSSQYDLLSTTSPQENQNNSVKNSFRLIQICRQNVQYVVQKAGTVFLHLVYSEVQLYTMLLSSCSRRK